MTRKQTSVVAAALLAAACGRGPSGLSESAANQAATQAVPLSGTYQLRLLGVNAAGFDAVRLRIHAIEVRAGGVVLTGVARTHGVDLADTGEAWLLGTFGVPAGATELEATVILRDGGSFSSGARTGEIGTSCTVLRVKLLVSQLQLRNHGVIHLDVARSLVARGEAGYLLVPQLSVHY